MKIINFNADEHYSTYVAWCEDRGIYPFPPEFLKTPGWMVMDGDIPMCCCWSFMSNAVGVFWLASIISNPSIPAKASVKALDFLLTSVDEIMKALDYQYGFTDTPLPSLSKFLVSRGWIVNHNGAKSLMKGVA